MRQPLEAAWPAKVSWKLGLGNVNVSLLNVNQLSFAELEVGAYDV